MIRLLVADDEPSVREVIKTLVDLEFPGLCSWIGLAADGDMAVRLAEQELPNVAVLDIRMPGRDGLAVAEQLKAMTPDIHILLLTAYGEFSYAQQAVRLGLQEYLVKPFAQADLLESLGKAFQSVREADTNEQAHQVTNRRLRRVLVDQLLTASALYDKNTLQECATILGLEHAPNSVLLVEWMRPGLSDLDAEAVLAVVKKVLPDALPQFLTPQRLAVLVLLSPTPEGRRVLDAATDRLRRQLTSAHGSAVRVSAGGPQASGEELQQAHADALAALAGPLVRLPNPPDYAEALFTKDGLSRVGQGIEEAIASHHGIVQADLLRWGFHLLSDCRDRLVRVSGGSSELDDREAALGRELLAVSNQVQFTAWVRKALADLYAYHSKLTPMSTREIVRSIASYLNAHYMEEIDQASTSRRFGLSAAHLSRLFKQEIGQNFNAYLTSTRLQAARGILAETELSMRILSRLAGFSSAVYFATVFKRQFGISPTEYRESVGAGAQPKGSTPAQ